MADLSKSCNSRIQIQQFLYVPIYHIHLLEGRVKWCLHKNTMCNYSLQQVSIQKYIVGFFYILPQLYLNKKPGNICEFLFSQFILWRAKSKVYLLFAVFTHSKMYGDLLYILEQLQTQQMSVCFQFPNAFIGGQNQMLFA